MDNFILFSVLSEAAERSLCGLSADNKVLLFLFWIVARIVHSTSADSVNNFLHLSSPHPSSVYFLYNLYPFHLLIILSASKSSSSAFLLFSIAFCLAI